MLRGVPHRSSRPRARAEARRAQRDRRCLLGLTDCACVAHDREGALAEVAVRRVDWHGSTSTTSAPVARLPADGDARPGRKGPTLPPGTASVSPPESVGVAPRPKSVRALAPCASAPHHPGPRVTVALEEAHATISDVLESERRRRTEGRPRRRGRREMALRCQRVSCSGGTAPRSLHLSKSRRQTPSGSATPIRGALREVVSSEVWCAASSAGARPQPSFATAPGARHRSGESSSSSSRAPTGTPERRFVCRATCPSGECASACGMKRALLGPRSRSTKRRQRGSEPSSPRSRLGSRACLTICARSSSARHEASGRSAAGTLSHPVRWRREP